MTVFINNMKTEIFSGARLSDAVLAYSEKSYKMLRSGSLLIFDRFGNITEPDGPVRDGQRFFLKRTRTLH